MKKITTLLILCLIFVSCSKDDTSADDPNGNGNPTNNPSSITFENNTFTGSCIVTYSDGITYNGAFANGTMNIPSTGANKVIATIQPQNQQLLIIGRKEGISLKLNYNGSVLSHRTAVNGYVPIGTFAEFQLMNLNTSTLAGSYQQEDTLYFMNNVWTPIGSTNSPFNGSFDGNNKEIDQLNVSVTGNTNAAGLFGIASTNSQLSNIIIGSGNVKGQNYAAGVAAECGFITNCKNYANVEGAQASGVAWNINIQSNEISNCHNYGIIKSNGGLCSGVFGIAYGNTIKDCTNNNVLNGSEVSGIVRNALNVQYCINNGSIVSNGGIATGIASYVTSVKNCTNNGAISSNNNVFGITCGEQIGCDVENCINTANLTATNSQNCNGIGGGGIGKIIINCNNSGNINAIGGFGVSVSGITTTGDIFNCHNTGNIIASTTNATYKTYCGGISSNCGHGAVFDCTNTGNIESNGGVAGGIGAVGGLYINRCYNTGNINGEYAGGICGYAEVSDTFNIVSCYNSGIVTSTINSFGLNSGGILGSHYQVGSYNIENCYNIGNTNGGSMIGVSRQYNTGNFTVTISNCFWKQGTATFAIAKIIGYQGTISTSNAGTNLFSASSWPSATNGWTATDWKSLGSWNNGSPTYPKLIFEN